MKKILFMMTVALTSATAFGQSLGKKDWYAGVSVGPTVFYGMDDNQLDYGSRLAPSVSLTTGAWVKPWLAVDMSVDINKFKGVYTSPREDKHFATEEIYNASKLRYQKGTYFQWRANAKFDVAQLLWNCKAERKHRVLPYAGLGTATGSGAGNGKLVLAMDLGLEYRFNLSSHVALTADYNNGWLGEKLDNEGCTKHKLHYANALRVGLVYTFKNNRFIKK